MYHAPSFTSAEYETATVLASVLAGGRSSRLYRDLVYERRVAADVHAFAWPLEKVGMMWLVATARPGVSAGSLRGEVHHTLERLVERPPSEEEVEGARRRARRQLLLNLEGVGGRASFLAHAAVLRGEPEYLNRVFDRYGAVGAEAVADLASRVLAPERGTAVDVVPRGAGSTPHQGDSR
jgi:zinc protease